jgi:hypothetical protein
VRLLLGPGNPYDLTSGELEELADLLRDESPELRVEISRPSERAYGVTFWEVLNIWADAAVGTRAVATGPRTVNTNAPASKRYFVWAQRGGVEERVD